jgi:CRP-like cAMP-binding protein
MQSDGSPGDDGANASVAAALWSIPLFNACGPTQIAAASRLLRPHTAAAGTELAASELATHSFLLVRGHALADDEDGGIVSLLPGDLFGLLRFTVSEQQTSAVIALTELRVLVADVDASARLLCLDGVAHALVHGAAWRRRARVNGDDVS